MIFLISISYGFYHYGSIIFGILHLSLRRTFTYVDFVYIFLLYSILISGSLTNASIKGMDKTTVVSRKRGNFCVLKMRDTAFLVLERRYEGR